MRRARDIFLNDFIMQVQRYRYMNIKQIKTKVYEVFTKCDAAGTLLFKPNLNTTEQFEGYKMLK